MPRSRARVRYTAVRGVDRQLSVNKKTTYVGIGLVVLCLAYPGFAWLIGLRVEAALLKREQQAMDQSHGTVTLISRQYHRGVYGATEELTYGLGAAGLRALAPLAGISDVAALHLIVRNTIHHGPLPQFRTVGLATFTTKIELPTQLSVKLRALLGGEPAIQIRGRLGWFGGETTVIASPGFEAHLADGSRISWRELKATSSSNGNLSSISIDWTLAGFEIKSAKAHMQLEALQAQADLKRVFEGLYTGPFSMKIAAVKWQPQSSSSQTLIRGLTISGTGSADGDYYNSAMQFAADAVQTSGFSITHAGYAISFEHLHGPTLAAMMKSAGSQPPAAAAAQTMTQNFTELLLHEPVLNITHIGFAMPEGEMGLSAKASVPGLKREDLDGPQLQPALMQHLNVVADLRIDAALVMRLLASSGRKDALAAQIDALEHQGYIKRDGKAWTAHVALTGGKLTVNGQPYPPPRGR